MSTGNMQTLPMAADPRGYERSGLSAGLDASNGTISGFSCRSHPRSSSGRGAGAETRPPVYR